MRTIIFGSSKYVIIKMKKEYYNSVNVVDCPTRIWNSDDIEQLATLTKCGGATEGVTRGGGGLARYDAQ